MEGEDVVLDSTSLIPRKQRQEDYRRNLQERARRTGTEGIIAFALGSTETHHPSGESRQQPQPQQPQTLPLPLQTQRSCRESREHTQKGKAAAAAAGSLGSGPKSPTDHPPLEQT